MPSEELLDVVGRIMAARLTRLVDEVDYRHAMKHEAPYSDSSRVVRLAGEQRNRRRDQDERLDEALTELRDMAGE